VEDQTETTTVPLLFLKSKLRHKRANGKPLSARQYPEARYGERKAIVEAEDWDGPAYQTCRIAASVCGRFELFRRRNNLGFTHHAEVAAIPPAEADALIDWCEETRRRA
jgi:hypothetical protein